MCLFSQPNQSNLLVPSKLDRLEMKHIGAKRTEIKTKGLPCLLVGNYEAMGEHPCCSLADA
jgi:hypothetical protein